MDHIAIMKKSWGLIDKILKGDKKIESRWYKTKRNPWDVVKMGDVVYFKNSSEPITVKADVCKVIQFSDLTPVKIKNILKKYTKQLGVSDIDSFFEIIKDKKYCVLVFLKNPEKINPFQIDKSGFGMMSAWISVKNINKVKFPRPTRGWTWGVIIKNN